MLKTLTQILLVSIFICLVEGVSFLLSINMFLFNSIKKSVNEFLSLNSTKYLQR